VRNQINGVKRVILLELNLIILIKWPLHFIYEHRFSELKKSTDKVISVEATRHTNDSDFVHSSAVLLADCFDAASSGSLAKPKN